MCREVIIPVKLSGRVSPAKPCSALLVPSARPTHGMGCTVHGTSDGRGRGCVRHDSSTSKSGWEAWTNQDMSLKEQNSSVQSPAPYAPCGTLNYTQVLHSHCIRSPDMSKTDLIRANLKQPNIITLHCAMHNGAARHKHFMSAFTNKCIWSLLSSQQKFQQHAAQLKQPFSSVVSLKTTVLSSIRIIKTE